MSWKRYFTPVPTQGNTNGSYSPFNSKGNSNPGPASSNYSSHLPDVYIGSPNRIERYNQYNTMDSDSEVNAALDILGEFTSQQNKQNDTNFTIDFKKEATNAEVKIIGEHLKKWCKINEFNTRMFRILRNAFKYGDQFFVRDPETYKWFHVDPSQVTKIIVNESEGKRPEQYVMTNLNFAFDGLEATPLNTTNSYGPGGTVGPGYQTVNQQSMTGNSTPAAGASRFEKGERETYVDANHVIHISMSEGLDQNYPFGNSLLETVFKVYKQKELLEDAIIIYRVQRAPERRVFYVDVGNMPSHLAMQFVERVKTEIHQRRIPSKTGGGQNVVDSSYNPLSINEDYFFPQTAEGRGSKVETLPGGTNLGEIDDLRYFTNKLVRGLRIPSSYLPTGADDGASQYNDGRVGTAYIQELRFNNYCQRLQSLIEEVFNSEFKLYLKKSGANLDFSMFDLKLTPPQNFAAYRQAELDNNRIGTFGQMQAIPFMSNRFAMKRFLGLTEEEIAENERLWREENAEELDTSGDPGGEMRAAGLSGAGLEGDLGGLEGELPDEGMEGDLIDGEPPETNTGADLNAGDLGAGGPETSQTI
jgi:hypothetical protein